MNKLLIFMVIFIVGCNCGADGEKVQTSNPEVNAEKFFEVDGCTIYRFQSGASIHYFSKCPCNSHIIESPSKSKSTPPVVYGL